MTSTMLVGYIQVLDVSSTLTRCPMKQYLTASLVLDISTNSKTEEALVVFLLLWKFVIVYYYGILVILGIRYTSNWYTSNC